MATSKAQLEANRRYNLSVEGTVEATKVEHRDWEFERDERGRRLIWITPINGVVSQSAIVYPNGNLGYDFPERLPRYVKLKARELAKEWFGEQE